jgi:hypothetical protein
MAGINLGQIVRKEITAGILLAALCLSGIFWFLAYTQEKAEAFNMFTQYGMVSDM